VVQFALHVGVEEVVIAFAATPEDVVFATQFQGDFQRLLHLSGGKCEHVGVTGRRGPVHEAWVREHVGRAPQQLDPGPLLSRLQSLGDDIQILFD